jgi:hypothetical protein
VAPYAPSVVLCARHSVIAGFAQDGQQTSREAIPAVAVPNTPGVVSPSTLAPSPLLGVDPGWLFRLSATEDAQNGTSGVSGES